MMNVVYENTSLLGVLFSILQRLRLYLHISCYNILQELPQSIFTLCHARIARPGKFVIKKYHNFVIYVQS